MKTFISIFFLINTVILSAQPKEGYMIFQAIGEVTIMRGKDKVHPLEGSRFLPGDYLTIDKGWISLLDYQMKRVTLKEPCKLSFETLGALFQRASSSMENKYLRCLWEKMNAVEEHSSVKGGAVRGNKCLKFPYDSAVVLTNNFCYSFENPSMDSAEVIIKDRRHEVIQRIPVNDSMLCINSIHTLWWKAGTYFWTLRIEHEIECPDRLMIIPSVEERAQITTELKEIKEKLKDIPDPEFSKLVKEIVDLKKWTD